MSRDTEIAWAAGLFEGEGCFTIMRQQNRFKSGEGTVSALASLNGTDQDTVYRFHAIVGVGNVTIREPGKPHHKRQWIWQSAAIDDVRHVVRLFAPWLGERRRTRAQEMLAAYESAPMVRISKTHCRHGHEFTTENTYLHKGRWRRCIECRRESGRRAYAKRKVAA